MYRAHRELKIQLEHYILVLMGGTKPNPVLQVYDNTAHVLPFFATLAKYYFRAMATGMRPKLMAAIHNQILAKSFPEPNGGLILLLLALIIYHIAFSWKRGRRTGDSGPLRLLPQSLLDRRVSLGLSVVDFSLEEKGENPSLFPLLRRIRTSRGPFQSSIGPNFLYRCRIRILRRMEDRRRMLDRMSDKERKR
ncbi:hypothetical protein BT96DRAFT_639291 [Gymnopus androsaceus JB14]|uniref:Uncharacterized protein n=1 Tax=Gymnopus androsaceus JB14 TaxID=1447944 RepID=A0A6A4HTP1_9AGAR|nr:hypothetical protein BT96DRAFT_639291 [Gymnopus androsaceus JB14]